MKVVRLSALRTGRVYPPRNIPGTHFCWRLCQSQGHSATGRIMSIKNSSDINGNRTRDLPAGSAVPQPTASPCAPCNILQTENSTPNLYKIFYLPINAATCFGLSCWPSAVSSYKFFFKHVQLMRRLTL